jgi:hypothetical protein
MDFRRVDGATSANNPGSHDDKCMTLFDETRQAAALSIECTVTVILANEADVRLAKVNISTPFAVFGDQGEKPFVGIAQASMRHVAWELMNGLDDLGDIS